MRRVKRKQRSEGTGRSDLIDRPDAMSAVEAGRAIPISIGSLNGRRRRIGTVSAAGEAIDRAECARRGDFEYRSRCVSAALGSGAVEVAVRTEGQSARGLAAIRPFEVVQHGESPGWRDLDDGA